MKMLEEAIKSFDTAVQIDSHKLALFNNGLTYELLDEIDDAI